MEKVFTTTQAIDIMRKVGCDIDTTSIEQFKMGLDCESDHFDGDFSLDKFTDDKDAVLGRIVAQHLSEDDDYYSHLKIMEGIVEKDEDGGSEDDDEKEED